MLDSIKEAYRLELITRKECLVMLHDVLGYWSKAWAKMDDWGITGGYSAEKILIGDADAF